MRWMVPLVAASLLLFAAPKALAQTPIEVVDSLATMKRPTTLCFGWSQSTRTYVCHRYEVDIQSGAEYSLEFIGQKPGTIKYFHYEGYNSQMHFFRGMTRGTMDHKALARARARLKTDAFKQMPGGSFLLTHGRPQKLSGVRFRVVGKGGWVSFPGNSNKIIARPIGDIQIRCKRRWQRLALFPWPSSVDYSPSVRVYMLPNRRLLIATTLHVREHGNSGAQGFASIETHKSLCNMKQSD